MTRTTRDQRVTIQRKYWLRGDSMKYMTYRQFRATVLPTFGCDGAVTVYWCGMWLCIERDGHCHS